MRDASRARAAHGPHPVRLLTTCPHFAPTPAASAATEVSVSPVYRAAFDAVAEGRGLAPRFPRFVRERPDKAPADATSAEQLAEIFRTQPVNSAAGHAAGE